ncbi:unnamed protein product [Trifolium pratense]|uniref:Uncharacterized protein n=1 Tax=Trifolium pratense TaxID=57577 RepID=A0ACB0J6X5_TRIPR|nr:unnamed protein product [Trifolium pratense]
MVDHVSFSLSMNTEKELTDCRSEFVEGFFLVCGSRYFGGAKLCLFSMNSNFYVSCFALEKYDEKELRSKKGWN